MGKKLVFSSLLIALLVVLALTHISRSVAAVGDNTTSDSTTVTASGSAIGLNKAKAAGKNLLRGVGTSTTLSSGRHINEVLATLALEDMEAANQVTGLVLLDEPWEGYESATNIALSNEIPVYVDIINENITIYTEADIIYANPNASKMFYQMHDAYPNITTLDMTWLNTSKVTNMTNMFTGTFLTELNVSNWDTSNVTLMNNTFCNVKVTNLNISEWDVSNVTDFYRMFYNCGELQSLDVSDWNTGNAESMAEMFYGCRALTNLDVSRWDTSNVTEMFGMFVHLDSYTDILPVSNWDVSSVTDFYNMFGYNTTLRFNVNSWNVSSATNMGQMFRGCTAMTSMDLSGWNVGNVTNMNSMFTGCSQLTTVGDLSGWDTSSVINMSSLFNGCTRITSVGDLSGWNVSNVTDMSDMFYKCGRITSLGDLNGWNVSSVTNFTRTFNYCTNLVSIGELSGWDTSSAINMGSMFAGCFYLEGIGSLDDWDMSHVKSIAWMFDNCRKLTTLGDLSGWDTSNVENMSWAFDYCLKLESLNIRSWDTSNVTSMKGMFEKCQTLTSLDLSGWDTTGVTDMTNMLSGCTSLEILNITNFDLSNIDTLDISGLTSLEKLYAPKTVHTLTLPNKVNKVWVMDDDEDGNTDIGRKFAKVKSVTNEPHTYVTGTAAYLKTGREVNTAIKRLSFDFDDSEYFIEGTSDSIKDTRIHDIRWSSTPFVSDTELQESGEKVYARAIPYSNYSDWIIVELYSPASIVCLNASANNTFSGLTQMRTIDLGRIDSSDVTNMSYLFSRCGYVNDLSQVSCWDTSNVTNMQATFQGCSRYLTTLDLSGWNVSKVVNMTGMFNNDSSLVSVDFTGWDTSNVCYLTLFFSDCKAMDSVDVSHFNTSKVRSFNETFGSCEKLDAIDISGWDTSNATNMGKMFYNCKALTDIVFSDSFATSKVDYMGEMFAGCLSLPENKLQTLVNTFDTSKVTGMQKMFYGCRMVRDLDLSNFNTVNVTNMTDMFSGNPDLETLDISSFDLTKVTSLFSLEGLTKLTHIKAPKTITETQNIAFPEFDEYSWYLDDNNDGVSDNDTLYEKFINNVTNNSHTYFTSDTVTVLEAGHTFNYLLKKMVDPELVEAEENIDETITSITFVDTPFVSDTEVQSAGQKIYARLNGTAVELYSTADLIYLNSDSNYYFRDFTALETLDLSRFDASKSTRMISMFKNCHSLTALDLSGWDVSSVTEMSNMFDSCKSLISLDLGGWDTGSVRTMNYMFYNCAKLPALDVNHFDTSNVTTMAWMFAYMEKICELDLGGWDTGNVTSMGYMFSALRKQNPDESYYSDTQLRTIIMTGWNTSKVVNMQQMFYWQHKLTFSSDISEWDVSKVETTKSMFSDCFAIETLNIKEWNTANLKDMRSMFQDCLHLTELDLSDWNVSNVKTCSSAFWHCPRLITLSCRNWNLQKTSSTGAVFGNCYELKNLDLSGFRVNTNNTYQMFYNDYSLTELDLSGFRTSNATSMEKTFLGCESLTSLDLSTFTIKANAAVTNMLTGATGLQEIITPATIAEGKEIILPEGDWYVEQDKVDLNTESELLSNVFHLISVKEDGVEEYAQLTDSGKEEYEQNLFNELSAKTTNRKVTKLVANSVLVHNEQRNHLASAAAEIAKYSKVFIDKEYMHYPSGTILECNWKAFSFPEVGLMPGEAERTSPFTPVNGTGTTTFDGKVYEYAIVYTTPRENYRLHIAKPIAHSVNDQYAMEDYYTSVKDLLPTQQREDISYTMEVTNRVTLTPDRNNIWSAQAELYDVTAMNLMNSSMDKGDYISVQIGTPTTLDGIVSANIGIFGSNSTSIFDAGVAPSPDDCLPSSRENCHSVIGTREYIWQNMFDISTTLQGLDARAVAEKFVEMTGITENVFVSDLNGGNQLTSHNRAILYLYHNGIDFYNAFSINDDIRNAIQTIYDAEPSSNKTLVTKMVELTRWFTDNQLLGMLGNRNDWLNAWNNSERTPELHSELISMEDIVRCGGEEAYFTALKDLCVDPYRAKKATFVAYIGDEDDDDSYHFFIPAEEELTGSVDITYTVNRDLEDMFPYDFTQTLN